MHLRLIIADSLPALSGSAIYDRHMADALRDLGHTVDISTDPVMPAGSAALVDGSALPRLADQALNHATVLVHHPLSLETAPPDAELKALETRLFATVRNIVTTGEQTANRLTVDFGVKRDRITVIIPGIGDLPRSRGSQGATCQILSVGQLIPRKGHDVLLKALARLFDLDWHLTIVGGANDPVHANGLQALAEELHIAQHVSFAGALTGPEIEALWLGADMFALTPHYEGYGMVFAEALRRGLPVLATATGAVQDLIAPDCGAVCLPGEIDQISKALRRMIFDAALRQEIAEAAWLAGQVLPSWQDQAVKLAAALASD